MISDSSVKAFLARKLDSHDWLKQKSLAELEGYAGKLKFPLEFHTKPHVHQLVCTLLGIKFRNWLFFLEPGCGKTKIVLDIFKYHRNRLRNRADRPLRALVLAPNDAVVDHWKGQAIWHAPSVNVTPLTGTVDERRKILLNGNVELASLSYPGFMHVCSTKRASGKKNRMVPDATVIRRIAERFDFLILDECHKIKDEKSLTSKCVHMMAEIIPYRYGLTGTPFARDPTALWSQFRAVDGGETLGYTKMIFTQAYCSKPNIQFRRPPKVKKNMEQALKRNIRHRSISYTSLECLDLPDRVFTPIRVEMPPDAVKQYNEEVRSLKKSLHVDVTTTKEHFIKMRQIASGFIMATANLGEGETERMRIEFKDNPRLDALLDLVEGIPETEKIVIFYEFTYSGNLMYENLKKRGYDPEWLWGGTKDKAKSVTRFKTDPKCRVIICQSQAGGIGIDLQVSPYAIFYESPTSPIARTQAEGRVWRQGQKGRHVFIYDIVVKNSVEERIQEFLKEGKDLYQKLVVGEAEL